MTGWRASAMVALLAMIALAGCIGDEPKGSTEAGGASSEPPSERVIDVDIEAIECPAGYDNQQADNICIAYNGQIPGPTWVFQTGERVSINLHHRVAETLADLGELAVGAERVAQARYSMHRHGVAQDACSDGVAQPVGTQICDSTVGPGESITYTFDTVFPGFWHYHDHSHTFSVAAARGPAISGEGIERGLWGSYVILPPEQSTQRAFDLHLTDTGANGGLGLQETAQSGQRFDLNVVGLGFHHRFFDVQLSDPDGTIVGEVTVGPGVSRGITVAEPTPGAYTWNAQGITVSSPHALPPNSPPSLSGSITVLAAEREEAAPAAPPENNPMDPALPIEPDRVLVIPFNHLDATARAEATGSMGLPLLEANVGELVEFRVINTDAVPHVFHLHGHSWVDDETGEMIDAVPMIPGRKDTHTFTVLAGLEAGYAGDWFYHCHIGYDSTNAAMWGILRVHP